ncbi:hypothetical protein L9F63_021944, partial [Diploptera punctata]
WSLTSVHSSRGVNRWLLTSVHYSRGVNRERCLYAALDFLRKKSAQDVRSHLPLREKITRGIYFNHVLKIIPGFTNVCNTNIVFIKR